MAPGLGVVEAAQQLGQGGLAGAVLADDGQRRPGRDGEVEAVQHRLAARVGEGDVAEADPGRRHGRRPGRRSPGAQRPGRPHGRLEPQRRRHRGGGAVHRPVEAAEGDGAGAHGHLGEHDHLVRDRGGRRRRRRPAPRTRPRWPRRPAPRSRPRAAPAAGWPGTGARTAAAGGRRSARSSSRPARTGAAPWPPAGRRPAGRRTRRGAGPPGPRRCCGPARPSSPAAASGWPARPRPAAAAPTRRTRTGRRPTASPPTSSTRPPAMKSIDHRHGRAGHAQVEVAGGGQVAGELRVLQVAHARRPRHGLGQPVVQPGRDPVAQVGAERLVERAPAPAAGRTPRRRRPAARPGRRRAARPRPAPRWPPRTPPAAAPAAPAPPTRRWPGPGRPCGSTPKNCHSWRSPQPGQQAISPAAPAAVVVTTWLTVAHLPSSPVVVQSLAAGRRRGKARPAAGRNHRRGGDVQADDPSPALDPEAPMRATSLAPRRRPGPGRRGAAALVTVWSPGSRAGDGGARTVVRDHAPLPLRALAGPGRAGRAGPVRAPQHRPDRPRVHPRRPRRPAPPRAGPRTPAPRRRPRRTLGRRRPGGRHHLRLPLHPRRPDPRVRLPPPRPLRLRHARHRPDRTGVSGG